MDNSIYKSSCAKNLAPSLVFSFIQMSSYRPHAMHWPSVWSSFPHSESTILPQHAIFGTTALGFHLSVHSWCLRRLRLDAIALQLVVLHVGVYWAATVCSVFSLKSASVDSCCVFWISLIVQVVQITDRKQLIYQIRSRLKKATLDFYLLVIP